MKQFNIKKLTSIAMMAAVMCVIAPFSIPVGEVPISMGSFAAYLAGVLLGGPAGAVSVLVYILIGMTGVPVFAGWTGGVSILAGPTGGYLITFIVIAYLTGFFIKLGKNRVWMAAIGMLLGTLICYSCGTWWLAHQLGLTLEAALWAGVIPYIPGDLIKMGICLAIMVPVKKRLKSVL